MAIEKKQKKCRGTGLAKGSGCSELMYIYRYGLCENCFKKWCYSTEEGSKFLDKAIIKGKRNIAKEVKRKKTKAKQDRIDNKSIAKIIQETRAPFQKLIRIRDHGKNCICCDNRLPFNIGDYDAGHFYKAELYTGIIFHPDNVHGQLVKCNKYDHGNELGYSEGIIKRIGHDKFLELKELSVLLREYSYSRDELLLMKKHYNRELRDVEKGIKSILDVDFSVGIKNK